MRRAIDTADQFLADAVVQIAGDAGACRLPARDELCRPAAGSVRSSLRSAASRARIVSSARRRLARCARSPAISSNCADNDDGRPDDVAAIGFPRCRRPESDVRPGRQPRQVDAPSPQLAPVERRDEPRVFDRNVLRPARRGESRAPFPRRECRSRASRAPLPPTTPCANVDARWSRTPAPRAACGHRAGDLFVELDLDGPGDILRVSQM